MPTRESLTAEQRAARVRLALFDVDGVLTDGRLYYFEDGSETKAFIHTIDGQGLAMLQLTGVQLGIISGRSSKAVERRARELRFAHVVLGAHHKGPALAEVCAAASVTEEECAFVGDDWPDLPPMRRVGLAVAVANARPEVRAAAHWVTPSPGGAGAARDTAEFIMRAQGTFAAQLARYTQ